MIYTTKGSGGNGINTVYFIDTTGNAANGNPNACPAGTGVPSTSASLPTTPIVYNAATVPTLGVTPYNMCVLSGFPTALKSTTSFPFGIWFANANTLYVADEGNGTTTYDATSNTFTAAAAQNNVGIALVSRLPPIRLLLSFIQPGGLHALAKNLMFGLIARACWSTEMMW